MPPPLVDINGLTVDFDTGARMVRVLRGIDFQVAPGEAVALVGESGSGKSVTWLAALGLLGGNAHIGGQVTFRGRHMVGAPVADFEAVRGRHIAMIFQDPVASLNPVHTIGHQLTESLRLHRGLDALAARAEARRLLERVGIADAARRLGDYPHELSGGLNQRVMIAIALAGRPELLIADEPTTALDATIQAQILDLLRELRHDTGMAMVLISHDLGVVAENADRVVVMYAGRVVEDAPVGAIFDAPAHPYTAGLVAALPSIAGPRRRLTAIPGVVPEPWNLPHGCAFAPRCPRVIDECRRVDPALITLAADHRAACIRAGEVAVPV